MFQVKVESKKPSSPTSLLGTMFAGEASDVFVVMFRDVDITADVATTAVRIERRLRGGRLVCQLATWPLPTIEVLEQLSPCSGSSVLHLPTNNHRFIPLAIAVENYRCKHTWE